MIGYETAYAIAAAHQEMQRAEELLAKVQGDLQHRKQPDVRDAFGRPQGGLQLGVPSGDSSHRLYHVDWNLCVPVLTAHVGAMKAKLAALNEIARQEIDAP